MTDTDFVDRMNRQHFAGRLSPGFLEGLRELPTERDDVKAFVDRVFRFMERADMRAEDLSTLQGHILGSLLARILPGAWQGRVPPITLKGRHQKIDRYVAGNRYLGAREAGSLLDLGCGFPPETTLDTADLLPDWTIRGADPSIPSFVVHDTDGAYATFDANDRMIYCQPSAPTVDNWNALLSDPKATTRRFLSIRDRLAGANGMETADGARLVLDPKASFERPGLTFDVGGIGTVDASDLDVVRCFNVMYYFTDDFREKALQWFASVVGDGGILMVGGDWAFTTECRYFLYQKEGDTLHAREFAFSLDNVLPLGVVPFFALHDKDRGLTLLSRLIRVLRQDDGFVEQFYEVTDRLRGTYDICPRGSDGYYGSVDPAADPAELWMRAAQLSDDLTQELGERAVAVLQQAGYDTYLNEIGMLCVSMASGRR